MMKIRSKVFENLMWIFVYASDEIAMVFIVIVLFGFWETVTDMLWLKIVRVVIERRKTSPQRKIKFSSIVLVSIENNNNNNRLSLEKYYRNKYYRVSKQSLFSFALVVSAMNRINFRNVRVINTTLLIKIKLYLDSFFCRSQTIYIIKYIFSTVI